MITFSFYRSWFCCLGTIVGAPFTLRSVSVWTTYHAFFQFSCVYTGQAEKAMAPHSSTLACKIPWMEEPGRLQSMRSLRVGHDWATSLSLFTFMQWRRKWQPTPAFLPGESQGRRSLVGCPLWGRTVGCDWSSSSIQAKSSNHLVICGLGRSQNKLFFSLDLKLGNSWNDWTITQYFLHLLSVAL